MYRDAIDTPTLLSAITSTTRPEVQVMATPDITAPPIVYRACRDMGVPIVHPLRNVLRARIHLLCRLRVLTHPY